MDYSIFNTKSGDVKPIKNEKCKFFYLFYHVVYAVKDEDKVAVTMRGLSMFAEHKEIYEFFKDFKFIDKSIVLQINPDGKKNGQGVILMDSEAEAVTAVNTKQEAHIGERFIKLEIISYKEYQIFNFGLKGKSLVGCFVSSIGEKITEENKTKCLLIKGLPFKI